MFNSIPVTLGIPVTLTIPRTLAISVTLPIPRTLAIPGTLKAAYMAVFKADILSLLTPSKGLQRTLTQPIHQVTLD